MINEKEIINYIETARHLYVLKVFFLRNKEYSQFFKDEFAYSEHYRDETSLFGEIGFTINELKHAYQYAPNSDWENYKKYFSKIEVNFYKQNTNTTLKVLNAQKKRFKEKTEHYNKSVELLNLMYIENYPKRRDELDKYLKTNKFNAYDIPWDEVKDYIDRLHKEFLDRKKNYIYVSCIRDTINNLYSLFNYYEGFEPFMFKEKFKLFEIKKQPKKRKKSFLEKMIEMIK